MANLHLNSLESLLRKLSEEKLHLILKNNFLPVDNIKEKNIAQIKEFFLDNSKFQKNYQNLKKEELGIINFIFRRGGTINRHSANEWSFSYSDLLELSKKGWLYLVPDTEDYTDLLMPCEFLFLIDFPIYETTHPLKFLKNFTKDETDRVLFHFNTKFANSFIFNEAQTTKNGKIFAFVSEQIESVKNSLSIKQLAILNFVVEKGGMVPVEEFIKKFPTKFLTFYPPAIAKIRDDQNEIDNLFLNLSLFFDVSKKNILISSLIYNNKNQPKNADSTPDTEAINLSLKERLVPAEKEVVTEEVCRKDQFFKTFRAFLLLIMCTKTTSKTNGMPSKPSIKVMAKNLKISEEITAFYFFLAFNSDLIQLTKEVYELTAKAMKFLPDYDYLELLEMMLRVYFENNQYNNFYKDPVEFTASERKLNVCTVRKRIFELLKEKTSDWTSNKEAFKLLEIDPVIKSFKDTYLALLSEDKKDKLQDFNISLMNIIFHYHDLGLIDFGKKDGKITSLRFSTIFEELKEKKTVQQEYSSKITMDELNHFHLPSNSDFQVFHFLEQLCDLVEYDEGFNFRISGAKCSLAAEEEGTTASEVKKFFEMHLGQGLPDTIQDLINNMDVKYEKVELTAAAGFMKPFSPKSYQALSKDIFVADSALPNSPQDGFLLNTGTDLKIVKNYLENLGYKIKYTEEAKDSVRRKSALTIEKDDQPLFNDLLDFCFFFLTKIGLDLNVQDFFADYLLFFNKYKDLRHSSTKNINFIDAHLNNYIEAQISEREKIISAMKEFSGKNSSENLQEIREIIVFSFKKQIPVHIIYLSKDLKLVSQRKIEVKTVEFPYFKAHCHLKKQERIFRLDRIKRASFMQEKAIEKTV